MWCWIALLCVVGGDNVEKVNNSMLDVIVLSVVCYVCYVCYVVIHFVASPSDDQCGTCRGI